MKNNINFILPNFMMFGRNEVLINFAKKHASVFNDCNIYSIYGTFPNAIFNGGRPCFSKHYSTFKEIKKIKKFYNCNHIKITLTFTNQCLEEKHLNDKYCNQILKSFHDGYNEVLVASPLLEKYIREKYPKYKINKSITATIKDGNEDYTNYNLVVIDKKNNRNFKYLSSIKDKNKIEILCDEICVNDCKYTNEHYYEISQIQLGKIEDKKDYGKCRYNKNNTGQNSLYLRNNTSKYYISYDEIVNDYYKIGFRFFKLSGREKWKLYGTNSILEYLIKKEYLNDVFVYVMERMFLEVKDSVKNNEM